ncbi:hypothetical protein QRX60_17645 [Amycolatopsis mongoliensis]|uniref:Excreted virulence factor EspC (Type VII ESX diderm) n=1 Tax=Amycolatopsis mongoliensis TaxID=715475 RepID=A0A9Y2NPH3_9PSEU|nr:hypothetical protein [Amycolatopsis sp. 4-36]WIY05580.1 hypothetical protein QRX60_17645 [Amycolatopsis sp. 4-36]
MGFQTVPDALRAAGRVIADALSQLRGADCAEPVTGLVEALPGGQAAPAASSFGASWGMTFRGWCTEAERYGSDLGLAADRYEAGDHGAAIATADAGRLHGPR